MTKPPKILYAIQGTGNGHVARAREIIPLLQKYGALDVVLSGDQSEVALPVMPKYRSKGLTFIYNKKGGISYWKTFLKNNIFKIYKEIKGFPVEHYDLVINDFEFITAWACRLKGKESYALGHQAAFFSNKVPRPKRRRFIGEVILKYYAPSKNAVGFHFKPYDADIYPPVIRSEVRSQLVDDHGHFTVYLPAFGDDRICSLLNQLADVQWKVFSKKAHKSYRLGNVEIRPIDSDDFLISMSTASGVLTSAGFETPAESLFLGKKLAVIPINRQYEQSCNSEALKIMGVLVIENFNKDALQLIQKWVSDPPIPRFNFPDITEKILVKEIINKALGNAKYHRPKNLINKT